MQDDTQNDALKPNNYVTGTLLTPWHLARGDDFAEAWTRWVVRYALPHRGLLGGGLRVDPHATSLERFDPRLEVEDDGTTVRLALLFVRGITPAGEMVDLAERDVVRTEVPHATLAGASEAFVSIVREAEREEDPASVGLDPANPHQVALRRVRYRLVVGAAADEQPHALVIGRIRRVSETLGFDRDGGYIPPCAAVLAHSALHAGWARLRNQVTFLAGRFSELHRAVATYVDQLAQRGVDVRGDLDTLAFAERSVLALDDCAYGILDPTHSTSDLFLQIERLGRRVAIALDLSSATRLFLHAISSADAGYEVLLDEERHALVRGRSWHTREDVATSLQAAHDTVGRVLAVCEALEGKYLDYRVNRTVDALRFLLERGGEGFYSAITTPGHPRRDGDLLTFDFSPLSLSGRQQYRVLLVGGSEGTSPWQGGEQFAVDLWVNPGAGGARPISHTLRCDVAGQRNFALTFDAPSDVGTVTSLRVTVHEQGHRIRRAILYQRGRSVVASVPEIAVANAGASMPPAHVLPLAFSGHVLEHAAVGEGRSVQATDDAEQRKRDLTPSPLGQPARDPPPMAALEVPRRRTIPLPKPSV